MKTKPNYLLLAFLLLAGWHCRRITEEPQTALQSSIPPGERPNIIFLLADDLRADALGYTGNTLAITPNIDSLANRGTSFRNTYATSAICAISRASILTGQYARRHGITNFSSNLSAAALAQTYPSLLKQLGYYTGFIGKYGVGDNVNSAAPLFNYWKGYPGQGIYFYPDGNGGLIHETALMGRQAQEFLKTRDTTRPFCLSVSFKAPHSQDDSQDNNGFRFDPYFNNWYSGVQFPKPETYPDSFYQCFPAAWRRDAARNKVNEARLRYDSRFSPQQFQTSTRAIYRLVSGIDKVVGELRAFLQAHNLDRNTIIVLSSDNGFYMGEHGLEGKWYGHEESIRLPLLIYDPREPAQRRVADEMVLNIDLAPTFLAWAGLTPPASMQGRPLQPLLLGSAAGWRNEFFYEHLYDPGPDVYIPKSVGVVAPPFKYLRYFNGATSTQNVIYEELYNVQDDPHEKHNLVNNADQHARVTRMKQEVTQFEINLR